MRKICMTMFLLATVFTLQVSVSRAQNRAMDTTIKSKWIPLFDGKSLNGWRGYRQQVTDAWDIEDGAIHNKGNADTTLKHADLTTDSVFGSFQLNIIPCESDAIESVLYLR